MIYLFLLSCRAKSARAIKDLKDDVLICRKCAHETKLYFVSGQTRRFNTAKYLDYAEVAELADAQASGACGSNVVWVQVPSSAPDRRERYSFAAVLFTSKPYV